MHALLIYGDDSSGSTSPTRRRWHSGRRRCPTGSRSSPSLEKADSSVTGKELDGRKTAKVVQVRDGERIVTDGPFAETKEILGGLFLMNRRISTRRSASPR